MKEMHLLQQQMTSDFNFEAVHYVLCFVNAGLVLW